MDFQKEVSKAVGDLIFLLAQKAGSNSPSELRLARALQEYHLQHRTYVPAAPLREEPGK